MYHKGKGFSRHLEFSAVSEAFSEQSINHLSSATVETFIPDPRYGLPVGPPFQCSVVMLFNCKHNNNYYYLRQRNRHLQSVHGYFLLFLPVAVGIFCCHAVLVVETGLQAHTMGRPGAAHVPAGRHRPVPSYSAIVNILVDGVSLTVILRGYLYRKHQLEGDGGYNANAQHSPPKTY